MTGLQGLPQIGVFAHPIAVATNINHMAVMHEPVNECSVPVPRIVYHCIETYLPHRQNHLIRKERLDQPALFLNRQGGRFKANMVSLMVRNIARRANVKLHSLYQFRHSCASDLLASGASLPEVQRILGHSSVSTTMRYP